MAVWASAAPAIASAAQNRVIRSEYIFPPGLSGGAVTAFVQTPSAAAAFPERGSERAERRLVHERDLLAELQDAVLPVALRIEPRERRRECRVVPAPGEPRRIVDEAQRPQRLDERELAPVELAEILVTREH